MPSRYTCRQCQQQTTILRQFSASTRNRAADNGPKGSFRSRLSSAWGKTEVKWYPIPIGLGIGFLGVRQFHKVRQREKQRQEEEDRLYDASAAAEGRPRRRPRVRPSGPWQVQIMSYLPLKRISRVWGWFNELTIPYYLRVPGFRLYSWIFGVNLSEVAEPDLHVYPNLASFFYRTLKPGVRPIVADATAMAAPADSKVLTFGMIEHGEVEQIKGMTYSLEALLGTASPTLDGAPEEISATTGDVESERPSEDVLKADEEFANVNGISYTLPNVFSGNKSRAKSKASTTVMDASTKSKSSSIAEVRADLALGDGSQQGLFSSTPKSPTALYYVVFYLAPGDYHRFHSPTSWVAEKRRHFAGELYSVSPYLQRTLPGLFTLNERVVLLGKWRWGFFSYTPVGATNVGSIKVNFDSELRTNSLTTDTAADRAAEEAMQRGEPYCGYAEGTYKSASSVLGGHALRKGEEMGGFQLGSSIVLVFEAPKGERPSFDEGMVGKELKGQRWEWCVEKGQHIKYGEMIGKVVES
jgi:phosphatidylserine decarboxylase